MAALRSRSFIAPLALLAVAALWATSLSFVAAPPRAAEVPASAPLLVAGNAALLASMPTPAHAGGMFDFGITLPFVAITFVLMMVILNSLWYAPVTSEMDERNAKLLQTLSEATDMLAKADEIQVEYTEQIRKAREEASTAVSEFRKQTESVVESDLATAAQAREAKAAEVRAKLEADVKEKMAAAESEIEARKASFVKETLASVSL